MFTSNSPHCSFKWWGPSRPKKVGELSRARVMIMSLRPSLLDFQAQFSGYLVPETFLPFCSDVYCYHGKIHSNGGLQIYLKWPRRPVSTDVITILPG
jgi:hypothetical protein